MKRILNMLLVLMLLACLGVFSPGCGHGDDSDPYTSGLTGGIDWDSLEEGVDVYSTIEKVSEVTIEALANDLISITREMAQSMGFNVGRSRGFPEASEIEFKDISLDIESDDGGIATINGKGVLVKNRIQRCILFLNLSIDYASYSYGTKATEYPEDKITDGNGEIRLIATSRSCNFNSDINVDLKMLGNINVNGVNVQELEFAASFQLMLGVDIASSSAVVNTGDGILYCLSYDVGGMSCAAVDTRTYNFDDMTTCSDTAGAVRRECDLPIDSYYEGTWMHGDQPISYEVHLRCSEDGIWTPPCLADGSFDICPYDSTCIASENVDWGPGLEGYGICSCSGY